MTIKVVSLNCWGGRIPAVVDFLRKVDADVCCLQEVYSAPPETPSPLTFEQQDELPAYSRLFEELKEGWPQHQAFFSPHSQGHLHDGATTEYPVRYGIATFVKDTLPVVEQASKFVFGRYRAHAWGEPPLPRTAHCIRVHESESRTETVIAHMHGLWERRGKIDTNEREGQVRKLRDLVQGLCDYGAFRSERVVICGDFNVLPDSYTVKLLQNHGLREMVTENGLTDTRTSYYKKQPRYADYMFVSPMLKVMGFEVIEDPEVSDHRPLLLEYH